MIESLPGMRSPSLHRPRIVDLHLSFKYRGGGGRRIGFQGYPWHYREFKATLGCVRPCLKKKNKKQWNHCGNRPVCPQGSSTVGSLRPPRMDGVIPQVPDRVGTELSSSIPLSDVSLRTPPKPQVLGRVWLALTVLPGSCGVYPLMIFSL